MAAKVVPHQWFCGGCGAFIIFKSAENFGIITSCRHCGWPGEKVIAARRIEAGLDVDSAAKGTPKTP